jgi:hypothetical protein
MDDGRIVVAAVVLGFIAIIFAVFAILALADIARGEPDLSLEWAIVRAALAIVVIAQVLSLVTIARLLRHRRPRSEGEQ